MTDRVGPAGDIGADFDRSSRNKLNYRSAPRFKGDTLFARIGRAVCNAGCLPRKELFESWECARRIRRGMRRGPIVEVAGGHGLLSALMIILDDSSPHATVVDRHKPASHEKLMAALAEQWPRLEGRVLYIESDVEHAPVAAGSLIASVHACGRLTDKVLDLAIHQQSRVAVMPCCHDLKRSDDGGLRGWVPGPLAVDLVRAQRLRAAGYRVQTARIPEDITPHNRLLLAWPQS